MPTLQRLTRLLSRSWMWVVALLLLAAVLLWISIENYRVYFGLYHDDAIYMVCSKALAEGHGYRIISLPGEPIQTKYPVGFPFFLAITWLLHPSFPDNLPIFETIQALIAVAAAIVATTYFITTRKVTLSLGLVVLAACLLNRRYLDCAPMVMSDLPLALLVYVSMWRTEIEARSQFHPRNAVLLGLLLAVAGLVRTQGLACPISCVAYLLSKRQFRLAMVACACTVITFVPAVMWGWSHYQEAPSVLSFYTGYLSPTGERPPGIQESLPIARTLYEGALHKQITTHFPFLSSIPFLYLSPFAFALIYRVGFNLLAMVLLLGIVRELRRFSLPGLYVFVCLIPACLFPVYLEWRYLIPLLPLTYYLYFRGFRLVGRWLKPSLPRLRSLYKIACGLLAFAFSLYLVAGNALESVAGALRYQHGIRERAPRFSPQAGNSDYYETFLWIKEHTKDTDTFVCNNDPVLFLYTGRKAVYPFKIDFWGVAKQELPDVEDALEIIRYARPKYIMIDPFYRAVGHAASPADASLFLLFASQPYAVKPVFTSSHKLIRIFEVDTDLLLKRPQER